MITKDWLNFYTPMNIANEIVGLLPEEYSPITVIDICVGSGNFLKAASLRWNNINSIGIDISPTDNVKNITKNIYKLDALNLKNLDKINFGKSKLILANPPFGKLTTNISTSHLAENHYELHLEAIKSKRIEALMLVSNLYILEENDIFAAVLPENIFESENLKKFKELFLANFKVFHLGETKQCFKKSEVKTRIFIGKFILNKNFKSEPTPHVLSPENNIKVLRGIDNSKLLKSIDKDSELFDEVVHFSNNEGTIKLRRYIKKDSFSKFLKISKYDILVSRVGRNSGKIHTDIKDFEGKYLSDYFYLVKGFRKIATIRQLKAMENYLLQKKKGLTARYICKQDIVNQINNILNEDNSKYNC